MSRPLYTPIVAVTGGIGSGKTFVCDLLRNRGIDIYDCDSAAKRLMRTSADLQRQLADVVGTDVVSEGVLQKHVIADFLLKSDTHRQAINDVVHPAVAKDFLKSGATWFESAILFESGFYKRLEIDYVVCVSAPLQLRIDRLTARDGISVAQACGWIDRQWQQEDVETCSDFVIVNDGAHALEPQIDSLLECLSAMG